MNTTNTFLRYFNEQTGYETFASIADVQYVGNAIDPDSGKDLDYDRDLYSFDGMKYNKIA